MASVLLIIIYIAFIGLGLPDSLWGAAWPAIYAEWSLPISFASFVSVIICCGTIVSSLSSARLIARFGTNLVTACSTALTAAALLGFSLSGNFLFLCLFSVPLGLGAGAIDTALNNYVSLHYSAVHMNFLHCFFGVGVSISPYILSLVISGSAGWRGGYRTVFGIQLAITLLLFLTLPVWKKAHGQPDKAQEEQQKTLTLRETARIPGVTLMWCLFIASCAIECTCGGWGSTFLVEYKGMAAEQAARVIMFYYIGMALGRFLSGVLAVRLDSWQIIRLGQIVLGAALVLLFLPGPALLPTVALFLVGLGNGPMFPNFNFLTPRNFGKELSQSVMGTQMAASYVGIMATPALCGLLGQAVGMGIFPPYLAVFYIVLVTATAKAKRLFTQSGQETERL